MCIRDSSLETRSSQISEEDDLPELPVSTFYMIPTRNVLHQDADPASYDSHKFHAPHPRFPQRITCVDRPIQDLIPVSPLSDEWPRVCKKCVNKHLALREWFDSAGL